LQSVLQRIGNRPVGLFQRVAVVRREALPRFHVTQNDVGYLRALFHDCDFLAAFDRASHMIA
jgi:hypothetical protein